MIEVTRKCMLTGKRNTMALPLTQEAYNEAFALWQAGALIQKAFPTLSLDEREFVKSGITPDVWERVFGA
jgi:hypothetical protein